MEIKEKHLTLVWVRPGYQNLPSVSCVLGHSVVFDSVTPWTVACQLPLSMGFPRQEYWSRLPFPTPGDLPDPRIKPHLLHCQIDALPRSHLGSLGLS